MLGETISHYRITKQLGAGGMGVVYEAVDTKLDRTVALKLLPPESTRDPQAKTRFIREAKAAAGLSHPNIATIHEIDEADGQLFIAMECVEGQSLKERIASGPLPVRDALDFSRQIAAGLVAGAAGTGTDARILILGFLGGFTTFSTWSVETLALTSERHRSGAALSLIGMLVGGLLACAIGFALTS